MKQRKECLWMGMLVIVLGLAVVGCDNGSTSKENDIWSNITSFSQLDGTWKLKSTPITTFTYKELLESSGGSWNDEMESLYGDMKITYRNNNYTITFDSIAKTQSDSVSITMTYSGGNIDTVWPKMRPDKDVVYDKDATFSYNDANHSVTMVQENNSRTFRKNDEITELLNSYQINQNETKIRPKYTDSSLASSYDEFVLIKQ